MYVYFPLLRIYVPLLSGVITEPDSFFIVICGEAIAFPSSFSTETVTVPCSANPPYSERAASTAALKSTRP